MGAVSNPSFFLFLLFRAHATKLVSIIRPFYIDTSRHVIRKRLCVNMAGYCPKAPKKPKKTLKAKKTAVCLLTFWQARNVWLRRWTRLPNRIGTPRPNTSSVRQVNYSKQNQTLTETPNLHILKRV